MKNNMHAKHRPNAVQDTANFPHESMDRGTVMESIGIAANTKIVSRLCL